MSQLLAGIDIHKKVLMVVVATVSETGSDSGVERQIEYESRRLGSGASEREQLVAWLRERRVEEVERESTAQYGKPLWLDLEPHFRKLHLAQAYSNKAPKGRKNDFGDAKRLRRPMAAGEWIWSWAPDAEQRVWRTMTRSKLQLVRDRVRLQNQLEALLEETRIKLSSVISDLLGVSGRRIREALAGGQTDPVKLAELGDDRLKCSREELVDALRGRAEPIPVQILKQYLERLKLLDRQIEALDQRVAQALRSTKRGEAAGRNTGTGSGLGAANHRRGGDGGEGVPVGGAVRLLGGHYSGKRRKRRDQPQFSIPEGEQVSAADPDPGSAGSGQQEGLSLPERVSKADAQAGIQRGYLGDRPQALSLGLEDPPRQGPLCRARLGNQPAGQETPRPETRSGIT